MPENPSGIEKLLLIMDALRDPVHGCPWDLEQDFATIAPHTLEETYEVIDAIEEGDFAQLKDELGDLLFQVVFYARLGKEQGRFDFDAVAAAISAKLLHRHPHVFPDGTLESAGDKSALDSSQVKGNWERIKAHERQQRKNGRASAMDDIPLALSALLRAGKIQKRAALQGFDWPDSTGVFAKIREEVEELEQACEQGDRNAREEEFGDLLFSVVNLGRHLDLDAETALRKANRKFERRYRALENMAAANGEELRDLPLETMEAYWQKVKEKEL